MGAMGGGGGRGNWYQQLLSDHPRMAGAGAAAFGGDGGGGGGGGMGGVGGSGSIRLRILGRNSEDVAGCY